MTEGMTSEKEYRHSGESSSSSSTGMTSCPSIGKQKIHKVSSGDGFIGVPHATRLQQVGVKLKASKGSLIDIKYENGVLSVPTLKLDDDTERILQNLIAHEQCGYPEEALICSYIKFMESLVKTEDDARLLIHKGIIVNMMSGGHDHVKELLQRLCKHIVLPVFFYQSVCQQLRYHCENCWYRTVAEFMHEFCSKPWSPVATVIVILLFLIAFLRFILPYSGITPSREKRS
ncbi:hypothetical protein M5689_000068 [Euphorbia peplus]|nr:hypothetical protein M5689_000068 [Euphorbia peplus]